jgi:hypothetical protein
VVRVSILVIDLRGKDFNFPNTNRQGKVKLPLFADDMILYPKDLQKSPNNF